MNMKWYWCIGMMAVLAACASVSPETKQQIAKYGDYVFEIAVVGEKNPEIYNSYPVPFYERFRIPDTDLSIQITEFLPEFIIRKDRERTDKFRITTLSDSPVNPAVLVKVYDQDKYVFETYLFKRVPKYKRRANLPINLRFIDYKKNEEL